MVVDQCFLSWPTTTSGLGLYSVSCLPKMGLAVVVGKGSGVTPADLVALLLLGQGVKHTHNNEPDIKPPCER